LEAMAQVAAIGLFGVVPDHEKRLLYLSGVDRCKFRRPVLPGDQLRIEAEIVQLRSRACRCKAAATVGGALCAEAELLSTLADRPGGRGPTPPRSCPPGPGSAPTSRSGPTPSSAPTSRSETGRPSARTPRSRGPRSWAPRTVSSPTPSSASTRRI